MTTHTHNHLLLTTKWNCTSGVWLGETAQWGLRFANGSGGGLGNNDRPALDAGQVTLNSFDAHTDVKSRSLTVSGVPGTLAQNWQGDSTPIAEWVTENDIDFLVTKAIDFAASAKGSIPTPYTLESIKLYAVDQTGHSPLGPNTWTPSPAYNASGGTTYLSPEVAMCISLYTAHRAKAGRGRVYLGPLTQSVLQTDGRFSAAMLGVVPGWMKTLQDSVRTRGTPQASAVYSGIVWNRSPGTTGCVINRVRVGDEPDVQERRTKKRPETFTDANVA